MCSKACLCPWIPLSVVNAVNLPVPEACWYPTGKAVYKRLSVQSADGYLYSLDHALRYLVDRQTVTLLPPMEADEELAAGCHRSTGRRLASTGYTSV